MFPPKKAAPVAVKKAPPKKGKKKGPAISPAMAQIGNQMLGKC